MTDPVDTNALRDLQALSGGILSRQLLHGSGVWKMNRDVTSALGAAADELDRLRAVIENGPHADDCAVDQVLGRYEGETVYKECTCWKAGAL